LIAVGDEPPPCSANLEEVLELLEPEEQPSVGQLHSCGSPRRASSGQCPPPSESTSIGPVQLTRRRLRARRPRRCASNPTPDQADAAHRRVQGALCASANDSNGSRSVSCGRRRDRRRHRTAASRRRRHGRVHVLDRDAPKLPLGRRCRRASTHPHSLEVSSRWATSPNGSVVHHQHAVGRARLLAAAHPPTRPTRPRGSGRSP
jgi:hypothetical protein